MTVPSRALPEEQPAHLTPLGAPHGTVGDRVRHKMNSVLALGTLRGDHRATEPADLKTKRQGSRHIRIYGESGIAGGPVPMDIGQIKGDKSGKGKQGKGKD